MDAVDRLCSRYLLFLYLLISGSVHQTVSIGVGINYGQIANDLPSPTRVASLLRSINISRIKLYDADQNVLSAFLNSNVEFIIGIGNEIVGSMMDVTKAQAWLQQYVEPYIPNARITCITVGNEVYSSNDTTLMANLLPAMQSVYQALVSIGLDKQIKIDSVYSAIKAMGHTDVDVRISETGWPSKGDPSEFGATPENAAAYNGNLLQRISMNQGTPLMPSVPIDIHVFALFNENLKPGPTSERNYGLFYPDGTPVYNIGLKTGHLLGISNSPASNHV
ncbi:hypothetical protein M5K25_021439 [Dendrobium thyrsiflorum]|uniref:Glucan endo-1,3-beta-D-glucosidase n=1 Tax=Dendrobium thyrsiflorum TaxID=117978 RepID=A0ABD0UCB7_DENTH